MLSQQKISENTGFIRSKPIDIINKNNNMNNISNYNIDYINTLGDLDNNLPDTNNYKLDTICFDPSKFSPPDEWCIRLKNRIRNYHDNKYQYMDYLFDNK